VASHEIWAYSEKPALLAELITVASLLASERDASVVAVVIGTHPEAQQAISLGASKVLWLGEKKEGTQVEDYVPTLAALVEEQHPAVLLIGATRRGKAVAGRLSARIGTSAITDAKELIFAEGKLLARHMIFGGSALRTVRPLTVTALATVGLGMYEPAAADPERKGLIVEVPFVEPAWQVRYRERRQKKTLAAVNLAAAKRVVCPGRGICKQEDLTMISDLARLLEAEIGCTRPLSEGLDWLPRERYIGVSGAFIKPELYLGIGVSGQVQHTVGVIGSRIIAAINKDKNAPIFDQADYGIVGDLYVVVPALVEALKAH
jgi:electron transfer flavoprotein alpha subunit